MGIFKNATERKKPQRSVGTSGCLVAKNWQWEAQNAFSY